jgi:tetratricopeptide (TPR) repeat protein
MITRTIIFALILVVATAGGASANDIDRLGRIGRAYKQGNIARTIAAAKLYLESYPDDDLGWLFLGHARYDTNDMTAAKAAYSHAVELNANRVEALTGLGMVASRLKDYDEAMKWYAKAVSIDPNYGAAYSSMVSIALKRGDFAYAVKMGRMGVRLNEKDPVIAANLAIAYHFNKQIDERNDMAQTAVALGYKNKDKLQEIFEGKRQFQD